MCESVQYVCPGKEPEGTKRMLEKIRGKRDIRIHYHTQVEECRIINDQLVKSQGFDVDFSKLRYLFDFQPAFLDEVYPLGKPDTGRVCFGRLSAEAIEIYNKKRGDDLSLGTNFEFVEVEKANIYSNSGEVYFITFVAKDPLDKKTKVFQAKRDNLKAEPPSHHQSPRLNALSHHSPPERGVLSAESRPCHQRAVPRQAIAIPRRLSVTSVVSCVASNLYILKPNCITRMMQS
ncbi:hypothetical protein YC2023_122794 [Brassica napus]